jgi:hypothetical protein
MKPFQRRQVMIDQEVQGALIGRVVLYWIVCQATFVVSYGAWQYVWLPTGASPAGLPLRLAGLIPALLGSLLFLPLVIADVLRLSNRFVGPIWNLRNAMKRFELGDAVPPLELRRGDYWQDLLRRFNRLSVGGRASPQKASGAGSPVAFRANDLDDWADVHGLPAGGATSAEPRGSD